MRERFLSSMITIAIAGAALGTGISVSVTRTSAQAPPTALTTPWRKLRHFNLIGTCSRCAKVQMTQFPPTTLAPSMKWAHFLEPSSPRSSRRRKISAKRSGTPCWTISSYIRRNCWLIVTLAYRGLCQDDRARGTSGPRAGSEGASPHALPCLRLCPR